MVKLVFTFDIPVEKQDEYLKVTRERIKPYWESHGCQSYDVWQANGENTFMKLMLYPDMASMEKSIETAKADTEGKSIVDLFWSFAPNATRKPYIKKT